MAGFHKPLVLLMCLGVVGSTASAAHPGPAVAPSSLSGIIDVVLSATGELSGRFLDTEGRGIDGAVAVVAQGDQLIARTTTDRSGAYHFSGLHRGIYQLSLGSQTQTLRVWDETIAPPSARRVVTLVRQEQIVRGQFGIIGGTLGSTVGVVGGVAGVAGGAYAVVETGDARDSAEQAIQEAAELRAMMHSLMSP